MEHAILQAKVYKPHDKYSWDLMVKGSKYKILYEEIFIKKYKLLKRDKKTLHTNTNAFFTACNRKYAIRSVSIIKYKFNKCYSQTSFMKRCF